MTDLRSGPVTQPGEGMLEAMKAAPVGDDVYREDPTVNALEARDHETLRRRLEAIDGVVLAPVQTDMLYRVLPGA